MYSYIVGESKNGRQVYLNIISSAAGRCFSRQPYLVSLTKAMIASRALSGTRVRITQDMGRTIGNTNIVTTEGKDLVFYAHQPKQTLMARFVKNRSMEPSSELSIVLQQDDAGNYELVNVWVGPACPPFPNADDATEGSKPYWLEHALTAGSEPIDLQSMTSVCPY